MSGVYSINKLTPADKPAFVSLMSRAFARDPLFLPALGDSAADEKARRRAAAFVSFMFDKSSLLREEIWGVFDNGALLGAYVIEPPQPGGLGLGRGLRLTKRLISLLLWISGRSMLFLNAYMRVTRAAAPAWPHHYLIMIGVLPEAQGKGIGAILLKHVLNGVNGDPQSRGVALDTENRRNLALYERFGFLLRQEAKVGDLPVYCMERSSNSSQF